MRGLDIFNYQSGTNKREKGEFVGAAIRIVSINGTTSKNDKEADKERLKENTFTANCNVKNKVWQLTVKPSF